LAGLRFRPLIHGLEHREILVPLGLALWASAVITYAGRGASDAVTLFFLVGVFAIALGLRGAERAVDRVAASLNGRDVAIAAVLVAAFAPLYLVDIHNTPWDIGTDEMAVAGTSKWLAHVSPVDFFGINQYYFGFPRFGFIVLGKLSELMGGANLTNMRLVNALLGLGCIGAAFVFFRLFFAWQSAIVATVILGVNHSLIAISRMAMRDNTPLLVELIALILLYQGLSRRSLRATFLGGLFAALGFYVYYPGRLIVALCLMLIVGAAIFLRDQIPVRAILRHGAMLLFGFVVLIAPLAFSTVKADSTGLDFTKSRIILLPEGRETQADWLGVAESEAVKRNIWWGLTTFNSGEHDWGNKYLNYGHGFVDPLTGVLLWVGVAAVAFRFVKKRPRFAGDLLALGGFASIFLISAFVLNMAPNYTRLLIILPFVAYFGAVAVELIAGLLSVFFERVNPPQASFARWTAVVVVVGAIAFWNVGIFADYAIKFRTEGHDLGSAGRYIEARGNVPGYKFFLVADQKYKYFGWGYDYWWRDWLNFFVADGQELVVVPPDAFEPETVSPPFSIITSRRAWNAMGEEFKNRFPDAPLVHMRSDGSLIAIEVR